MAAVNEAHINRQEADGILKDIIRGNSQLIKDIIVKVAEGTNRSDR
jgi:hypothetical protein